MKLCLIAPKREKVFFRKYGINNDTILFILQCPICSALDLAKYERSLSSSTSFAQIATRRRETGRVREEV